MRIVTFCATQDSGKTTVIRELVSRLAESGSGAAVIVNERGRTDLDAAFVRRYGTHVERITGG